MTLTNPRLYILAVTLLTTLAGVTQQPLVCRGPGLDKPETVRVWNMSDYSYLSRSDRATAPRYVFSNKELSEIIANRRMRYIVKGDSSRWFCEETREQKITPESVLYTSAFGAPATDAPQPYTARGRYCGDTQIAQQGTYYSAAPVIGHIVNGPDTLAVTMTHERRHFTTELSVSPLPFPLDIVRDSLEVYTIDTYRWFAPGATLPMALQRTVYIADADGRHLDDESTLYTIDLGQYAFARQNPDSPADTNELYGQEACDPTIFDRATATANGHTLTVTIPGGYSQANIPINMAISSVDGIPCLTQTATLGTTAIDVSALLPRQYILTLSTTTSPAARKLLFCVQ